MRRILARVTVAVGLAAGDGAGCVRRDRADADPRPVTGVLVIGGKVKSLSLRHGELVITLRQSVSRVSVRVGAKALKESAQLRRAAKHGQIKRLKLTVVIRDSARQSTTVSTQVKQLHL